jgi:hypothetical protein
MTPRAGALGAGEGRMERKGEDRMERKLEEIRNWMKQWVIKHLGDIPRAYPLEIVYSCMLDPKAKSVIDTATPFLAKSVVHYINHDDPFVDDDNDEILFEVRLPNGTMIECTPANFLNPDCISAYYYGSSVRLFLDHKHVDP